MMLVFKMIGLLGVGAAVFVGTLAYNRRLLDWLKFQSIGTRDYVSERLSLMFIDIAPHKILIAQLALSFGTGFAVFLLLLPQVFPAILFGAFFVVVGWKAPKPVVDFFYKRRVNKFTMQMIDGLGIMSSGMKSGLSIVQALGLVTKEMPNPIRQEFELVLNQNKLGVPLEEAFINLSKRIESDDVEMFVTSVNILKETGGNLAETFDTIVTTIRERIKVENKIKAMTAQGFAQGVVVMMVPPALGFVFFQTDPEFMEPLVTTPLGWVIIFTVLALEIIGYFVIMKIIKIDV